MKNPFKTAGKKFLLLVITLIPSLALFTGCPVAVTLSENQDGTLLYEFKTSADEKFTNLILSFDENSQKDKTALHIFDTLEIENALLQTGFSKANAITQKTNSAGEALFVNAVAKSDKFSFIKTKAGSDGKLKKVELTLSPEILQELITNQNSIIQKYADLLMAPCFTDEVLSKEEYRELVASLYGSEIADELLAGEISISLKSSLSKQKMPSVKISLIEILTLTGEKTFTLEIL
ncbi:MAG: hypothetical protein ACI4LX_04955 [Treponema sp.]